MDKQENKMSAILHTMYDNMRRVGKLEMTTLYDVINSCDLDKKEPIDKFLEDFFHARNVSESLEKYLKWSVLTKNEIIEFFISKGYAKAFLKYKSIDEMHKCMAQDDKFTNDCTLLAERFVSVYVMDSLVFNDIGINNITNDIFKVLFDKYNNTVIKTDNLKFQYKMNILGHFFIVYALSQMNRTADIFNIIKKVTNLRVDG